MNILYVLHQDPNGYPAGIEQYTLDLINGLISLGYSISLFFPKAKGYIFREYKAVTDYEDHYYYGSKITLDIIKNKDVEKIFENVLHKKQFNAVHFQSLRNLPLSLIETSKKNNFFTITSLHEYFLWCVHFILMNPDFCNFNRDPEKCADCLKEKGYKKINSSYVIERRRYIKKLLHLNDIVISPSYYVKNLFMELYGLDLEQKIIVIENGTEKISSLPPSQVNKNSGLNIAFLGNFLPHKGSRVFEGLVGQFINNTNIRFFIIGNPYEKLSKDYPNLTIVGGYNRNQLSNILRQHSIELALLLSVIPETFSYTLSEAVLNGIPVMALDLGALRERISRYKVGFLIPHENPITYLKNNILYVEKNKKILNLFRKNSIKSGDLIPSIHDMIKRYHNLYQETSEKLFV